MIYPNYLYISYYQNSEYWWTDPIRNVSAYPAPECKALELTFAIFRSLAIDYFPMPSSAEENATTDVGYVSLNHNFVQCTCISFVCLHIHTCMYTYIVCTVVSWASAHSQVSTHVPHFKGSMCSLYTSIWNFDPG